MALPANYTHSGSTPDIIIKPLGAIVSAATTHQYTPPTPGGAKGTGHWTFAVTGTVAGQYTGEVKLHFFDPNMAAGNVRDTKSLTIP